MSTWPMTNTTPFPSLLLDEVMPTLRDTEWRVLCVIVRATLGWQGKVSGQRKESDWLTQSQLKNRTGRATEALSRAIDVLVRRGLVEVRSGGGEPLISPADRRRCAGRLFFRLCPRVLESPDSGQREAAGKGELPISVSERRCSETELRKPNTTKETGTTYVPNGREQIAVPSAQHKKPFEGSAPPAPAVSDVHRFIRAYCQTFRSHSRSGEPPPIAWGKDGKLVKRLLRLYSYDRLRELLEQFFESPDPWIRSSGYSLGAFHGALGKLLTSHRIPSPYRPTSQKGKWIRAGDINPGPPT